MHFFILDLEISKNLSVSKVCIKQLARAQQILDEKIRNVDEILDEIDDKKCHCVPNRQQCDSSKLL